MVRQIEELGTKLEPDGLGNPEIAGNGGIQVDEVRSRHAVSADVFRKKEPVERMLRC